MSDRSPLHPVTLVLAIVLAARVAAAGSDRSGLRGSTGDLGRVRVIVAGKSFEVYKATADDDGLYFRGVRGYSRPPWRWADPLGQFPEPPIRSPLAWSEIANPERRVVHRTMPAPIGGALGLAAGFAVGIPLALLVAFATYDEAATIGTLGAMTILGGVYGVRAIGVREEWIPIRR